MKKAKVFGLFYDKNKERAVSVASRIYQFLGEAQCDVLTQDVLENQTDAIITLGGDGFVLSVADLIAEEGLEIPIARINFGNVGFLTNVRPEKEAVVSMIKDLLSGNYSVEKRSRIEVVVSRKNRLILRFGALNDVVVKSVSAKTLPLSVILVDQNEHEIRMVSVGDGLIIATRTGSTAYNKSAGGPRIEDENQVVVTPICPAERAELKYPMIMSIRDVIGITEIPNKGAILTADGRLLRHLSGLDEISVSNSPKKTLFAKFKKQ